MRQALLLIAVLVPLAAAHAEIFKCADATGRIVFKETPCSSGESLIWRSGADSSSRAPEPRVVRGQAPTDTVLGKNLLRNPSFENRLVDWHVPLGARWSGNGGMDGGGALVIQAETPPDDQYIHETTVSQCVLLPAGEKYRLKARFMFDRTPLKAVANRANVIWYESTDCTSGGQWGGYIEPKSVAGWQDLSRERLTPALGAKAAKITIVQNGRYTDRGTAYWDDIQFAPTELFEQSATSSGVRDGMADTRPVGSNFLVNGAFDRNLDAWRTGWETTQDGAVGKRSAGAAKVVAFSASGSQGRQALSQCVDIESHRYFEMGAGFRRDEASTQGGGGRLRVTWYELQNCGGRAKIDGKWVDPTDAAGWQELHVGGLQAPGQSQSARIEVIQSIRGSGVFAAYWDDIYFKSTPPGE